MKLKTIFEMPHADYDSFQFGLVDFKMEKYKLPKEQIHQLMLKFHETGVVARSVLANSWLYFNDNEVRKANEEEINGLPHLPDDWENYLLNIK